MSTWTEAEMAAIEAEVALGEAFDAEAAEWTEADADAEYMAYRAFMAGAEDIVPQDDYSEAR